MPLHYLIIYPFTTAVALYHLIHDHKTNAKFLTPLLTSRNTGLSSSQYYRLMVMSMVIGVWGVVWGSFQLANIIETGVAPLPNWSTIHQDDSTVVELPLVLLGSANLLGFWLFWWTVPGAAYIFFLVFGTSRDIFLEYRRLWIWFRTTVLGRPLPETEWPMPTLPPG